MCIAHGESFLWVLPEWSAGLCRSDIDYCSGKISLENLFITIRAIGITYHTRLITHVAGFLG